MMDGSIAPVNSPVQLREPGLTLLQQVRGRYLSINYDVPTLLMGYVRLLDQLGVMCQQMKTCKLQCRMLYEGHSVLYSSLKKLRQSSSPDAEMRFAGGLELAWHALKPLHSAISEFVALDEMESWFRHAAISNQISEHWKTLDVAILELRSELGGEVESFVALKDTPARVLVVPGNVEIARRQVHRADQLEFPKLFKNLVMELGASSSLLFMKPVYIEEFMAAMQREMNSYPAKSQTYKLYDERLQQLYHRSAVIPPVNEFDTNDIKRTGSTPMTDSPFGPVWKGKTTVGDLVSVKLYSAFSATEKSRQTLFSEVQKWNRLRHPHLQRVLGIWYPPGARDGVFSVVSKGIKHGDAVGFIKTNPTVDRMNILLGAALGLQYLHSQGVPHGDLRGTNILIKDNGDACLTNFGLLQALETACDAFVAIALVNLGSVRWMAPEIYDPELVGAERGSVSMTADCHSFGMLMLEILTGEEPFSYILQNPVVVVELVRGGRPIRPLQTQHSSTQLQLRRGASGRPMSDSSSSSSSQPIDDQLWPLCEACWAFPPQRRLAVGQIVESIRAYQHNKRVSEIDRNRSPTSNILVGIAPGTGLLQQRALLPPIATGTIETRTGDRSNSRDPSATPSPSNFRDPQGTPMAGLDHPALSRVLNPPIPSVRPRRATEPPMSPRRAPSTSAPSSPQRRAPPSVAAPLSAVAPQRVRTATSTSGRTHQEVVEAREEEEQDQPAEEFAVEYDPPTQDEPPPPSPSPSPAPSPIRTQPIIVPVEVIAEQPVVRTSTPSRSSSDRTIRPTIVRPESQSPHTQSVVGTPRPLIERVLSSSSPPQVQRVQSIASSEQSQSQSQSQAQSQSSHQTPSSARTTRSPRHPDLANTVGLRTSSQIPLLTPSISSTEQQGAGGTPGNRLSTIPDVDDVEEDDEDGDAEAERYAAEQWADGRPEAGDWDFLRLVQEYRRQRQGPGQDGIYIPPAPSARESQITEDVSPESADRPHEFPPVPDIFPTPIDFSRGKPLPDIPPPSTSSRIEVLDIPDEDGDVRNRFASPALPPLPLSTAGGGTSSTETSGTKPLVHASVRSSAISARGSLPPQAESLEKIVEGEPVESRVVGPLSSRRSVEGGRTISTASVGMKVVMAGLADSTCSKCGRVFSSQETLIRHVQLQGGTCVQRSLKEELDYVGDFENE